MRAILISIQPQWVEKILNGEKTIEIRKTKPNIKLPCKVYVYCTKGKSDKDSLVVSHSLPAIMPYNANGKVIAEFTLKNISYWQPYWTPEVMHICDISEKSCVSIEDLIKYCGDGIIYAWHVEDLKIYDKPKELSEFRKDLDCDDYPCNKGGKNSDCEYCYYDYSEGCQACGIDFDGEHCIYKAIKRPPQSWCYVNDLEGDAV